jgi:hypothetical protein
VRSKVAGLSDSQLSAPEASGKWSMRQVVRHLADSDLVWGYRMRMVLAHDRPPITGYDQDLWAERLRYDRADLEQALQELAVLRRSNLGLLAGAPLRIGSASACTPSAARKAWTHDPHVRRARPAAPATARPNSRGGRRDLTRRSRRGCEKTRPV